MSEGEGAALDIPLRQERVTVLVRRLERLLLLVVGVAGQGIPRRGTRRRLMLVAAAAAAAAAVVVAAVSLQLVEGVADRYRAVVH